MATYTQTRKHTTTTTTTTSHLSKDLDHRSTPPISIAISSVHPSSLASTSRPLTPVLPRHQSCSSSRRSRSYSSPTSSRLLDGGDDNDGDGNHDASHAAAWDQTLLRINFLVATMGPNTPTAVQSPALSRTSSRAALAGQTSDRPASYSAPGTGEAAIAADAETCRSDGPGIRPAAAPTTPSWPAVPPEKVRRKIRQIETWRSEVADQDGQVFCACSTTDAASASEPVAAVPPRGDSPDQEPSDETCCRYCSCPPSPAVGPLWDADFDLDDADDGTASSLGWLSMRRRRGVPGVRKALRGIRGLVKRRGTGGRSTDHQHHHEVSEEVPIRSRMAVGTGEEDAALVRTRMYRDDIDDDAKRREGRDDADDDGDGDDEDELDLDDLSGSDNPGGLFETNERLRRAQRLLAKSNRGPTGAAAGSGTGRAVGAGAR